MINLLTVTAAIEVGAGLVLVALPSLLVTALSGSSVATPVELTLARLAGVALLALGVACWLARHDGQSRASRGLVGAMVLYNAGVASVFAYAALGLGLSGILPWAVVLLHAAMAAWCVIRLVARPGQISGQMN